MAITRKAFLGSATGGMMLLWLQGCGGSDDDGGNDTGNPPPGAKTCGATGVGIAGNHGHLLSIPAADLAATTDRSYDITGSANHPHTVSFTPAQLQALGAGQSVTVTSSTNSSHEHVVTATCV